MPVPTVTCPDLKRPVQLQAVSASTFYKLASLKRLKCQEATATDVPLATTSTLSILNPYNAPFKTFKTQQEAYSYLDRHPCAALLRTFAQELSTKGQREFIVTSAELFWQRYKELPATSRHHYEIIRQGAPCNLYFDLEFCPKTNPGIECPALVQLLLCEVARQLHHLFDIPWHDSFAVELDSSTPQKISRHVIVAVPGVAFADACHAGQFARLVLLRLLQRGHYSSMAGQMLVRTKDGTGLTTFVDMGVYTRNRAFRLYLSSKYGKHAVLKLTSRYGGANRCPQAAFYDGLVSIQHCSSWRKGHVRCSCRRGGVLQQVPVQQNGQTTQHPSQSSLKAEQQPHEQPQQQYCGCQRHLQQWQQQQQQQQRRHPQGVAYCNVHPVSLLHMPQQDWLAELQRLPVAWQQVPMLQLSPLPHNQELQGSSKGQQIAAVAAAAAPWRNAPKAAGNVTGMGPSPYPLLDQFITSICVQGGVQGAIRSWLLLSGSAYVTYNIKNNRWCGNIKRAHRSNGTYYVVDLAAGVYYQRCFDPDCRHYRSQCMPLPTQVRQAYKQQHTATADATNKGHAEHGPGALVSTLSAWQQQADRQQHWGKFSAVVDVSSQQWQQHSCDSGVQQDGSVAPNAHGGDDVDQYLEILQQFEQEQQAKAKQQCNHSRCSKSPMRQLAQ